MNCGAAGIIISFEEGEKKQEFKLQSFQVSATHTVALQAFVLLCACMHECDLVINTLSEKYVNI
jgi:hypothetical protein